MTDEEATVEACPGCGSSKINKRVGPRFGEHERYRCRACRHTFAEPTLRPPKQPGGNISVAGQALIDADPGDLLTDGGVDVDTVGTRLAHGLDLVCDGCGSTASDVRLVEVEDPDGRVTTCDSCEPQLRSTIVREISTNGVTEVA